MFQVKELVFIDGILDKNKYLSILKDNLIKSANNMNIRDSFKFYQDNDSKYKSQIVQEYLLQLSKSITSSTTVIRFKSYRKFVKFIRS